MRERYRHWLDRRVNEDWRHALALAGGLMAGSVNADPVNKPAQSSYKLAPVTDQSWHPVKITVSNNNAVEFLNQLTLATNAFNDKMLKICYPEAIESCAYRIMYFFDDKRTPVLSNKLQRILSNPKVVQSLSNHPDVSANLLKRDPETAKGITDRLKSSNQIEILIRIDFYQKKNGIPVSPDRVIDQTKLNKP